jgi:hypothetical protein
MNITTTQNGKRVSTRLSWKLLKNTAIGSVRILESSGLSREVKSKPPVSLQVIPGDYMLSIDVPETAPIQIPLHIENGGSPTPTGKK